MLFHSLELSVESSPLSSYGHTASENTEALGSRDFLNEPRPRPHNFRIEVLNVRNVGSAQHKPTLA